MHTAGYQRTSREISEGKDEDLTFFGYAFKLDMVFDVANDPSVRRRLKCNNQRDCRRDSIDAAFKNNKGRGKFNLLPPSDLENVPYGQALADYTGIGSLEYGALADATRMNLYSIASCGVIEYTAAVSNNYRLTLRNCTEYTRLDCNRNHYNPVRTECVQSNEVSVLYLIVSSVKFSKPKPTSCPFLRATSFQLGLPLTPILLPTLTTGHTLTIIGGTTTRMMTTGLTL
jgi:hypothetical protein